MSGALMFGASALALAVVVRRQYLLWSAARAIFLGLLALSLPPSAGLLFSDPENAKTTGLIAGDLAIAMLGPMLATYIEPAVKAPRLRTFLWSLLPMAGGLALAAAFAIKSAFLGQLHAALMVTMLLMLTAGLGVAMAKGSRAAIFQTVAWLPAIAISFVAVYHVVVLHERLPFFAQIMLSAFLFEIVVTSVGIGDGFMTITRERDEAVAGVREATRASYLDPLTGIANRRGLAQRFQDTRHGRPLGIAIIDCDHFKRINDNYGHDAGDDVLVAVAEGLKGDDQFVGRLGGEEFVAMFYDTDWHRSAEETRKRLSLFVRSQVQHLPFPVTASAGLATVNPDDTLESVIKRADHALYAAKNAGRNTSLYWHRDEPAPLKPASMTRRNRSAYAPG